MIVSRQHRKKECISGRFVTQSTYSRYAVPPKMQGCRNRKPDGPWPPLLANYAKAPLPNPKIPIPNP